LFIHTWASAEKTITLGAPLGIGKPAGFTNAYAYAQQHYSRNKIKKIITKRNLQELCQARELP
jgi:hypothetical protein